ncbi:MAG: hypothetical protein EBV16_05570, partial [Betaproteobacteria bacterium]|nr:hypothetical protein [Betaproteobacteria bacterium]
MVTLMDLKYLIPLVIGTLIGVIGGALPGITITMTIIVVLPFTFGLEPLQGLAAMIGVYVGGETGGLITSCLLGIPGKPSSVATMFDGFPMSRRGEPGRAVWLDWPSFRDNSPEECNIRYVAETRTQHALYMVVNKL